MASSVDSLSVIVTVVATVATSAVPVTSPVISPTKVPAKLPPATVRVFASLSVMVISPLAQLITPAEAMWRSDQPKEVVPSATPSLVTGDKAFSTNSTSSTLFTLRIILLSVVAKSIKF